MGESERGGNGSDAGGGTQSNQLVAPDPATRYFPPPPMTRFRSSLRPWMKKTARWTSSGTADRRFRAVTRTPASPTCLRLDMAGCRMER